MAGMYNSLVRHEERGRRMLQDVAANQFSLSVFKVVPRFTNLALFRQASTSEGSDEDTWGFVVDAEASQFKGGWCKSFMARNNRNSQAHVTIVGSLCSIDRWYL